MTEPGFIYVLINPSMEGLLKVGKTTRDPEGRVKELSGATAVPTPFLVAYKAFFNDCSQAERYVHTRLEQGAYRISGNREFFAAPLDEVIEIIQEAKQELQVNVVEYGHLDRSKGNVPSHPEVQEEKDIPAWVEVLSTAEAYHYGLGDTLQDYLEAEKWYRRAANLGCRYASFSLGKLCLRDDPYSENWERAMEYFKEGAARGDGRCWAEMACLFHDVASPIENRDKCWSKYFDSKHFTEGPSEFVSERRIDYVSECYQRSLISFARCKAKIVRLKDELSREGYREIDRLTRSASETKDNNLREFIEHKSTVIMKILKEIS